MASPVRYARLGHRHGVERPSLHALANRCGTNAVAAAPGARGRYPRWRRLGGAGPLHHGPGPPLVAAPGVPGVWFFSLDAANPFAVAMARMVWKLNYIFARFRVQSEADLCTYEVARRRGASSRITWRVGEPLPQAQPGSIEHFLTERYCLYSASKGRVWRGMVHHEPWTLCTADVPDFDDELVAAAGIDVEGPPLCHAARPVHVHGWPIKRIK